MSKRDPSPATSSSDLTGEGLASGQPGPSHEPPATAPDALLLEAVAGLPVRRHGRPPTDPDGALQRDSADQDAGVVHEPRGPVGHPLAIAMASALRNEPETGLRRLLNALRRQQPREAEGATEMERRGIQSYTLFASESPLRQSKTEYKKWRDGHELRGELLTVDELRNHLGGLSRSWEEVKRRCQEAIRYDPLARRLTQAHSARQPLEVLLPLRAWATRLTGPLRREDFLAWYAQASSGPGTGWDRRPKLTHHHLKMLGGWPAALAMVGCAGREAQAMQGAPEAEQIGVMHPELIDLSLEEADDKARAARERWRTQMEGIVERCLPNAWAQRSTGGWITEGDYNEWAQEERVALAALGQFMRVPSASTIARVYSSWPLALLRMGLISPRRAAATTGTGRPIDHHHLVTHLYWALLDKGPTLTTGGYERWCGELIDRYWRTRGELVSPPSVRSITRHLGSGSWPLARTRGLRGLRRFNMAPADYPFPADLGELELSRTAA